MQPCVQLVQDGDWVLYDDFSSDSIDPVKWGTDDSSAPITVENGAVGFVHNAITLLTVFNLPVLEFRTDDFGETTFRPEGLTYDSQANLWLRIGTRSPTEMALAPFMWTMFMWFTGTEIQRCHFYNHHSRMMPHRRQHSPDVATMG